LHYRICTRPQRYYDNGNGTTTQHHYYTTTLLHNGTIAPGDLCKTIPPQNRAIPQRKDKLCEINNERNARDQQRFLGGDLSCLASLMDDATVDLKPYFDRVFLLMDKCTDILKIVLGT